MAKNLKHKLSLSIFSTLLKNLEKLDWKPKMLKRYVDDLNTVVIGVNQEPGTVQLKTNLRL